MSEESVSALLEAFRRFQSRETGSETSLCLVLDKLSGGLAQDEAFRHMLPRCLPSIWEYLFVIWEAMIAGVKEEMTPSDLAISLARFTRNLVAGVPSNQNEAYRLEPEIRYMLHHLTSFTQLKDESLYPLTRMIVQALSNIVTLNDPLGTRLWELYTALSDDQNILARLLASPDTRTINATLVLILNSMNADGRTLSRLISPTGLRILIRLLDRTEEWVSNESGTPVEEEAFTISYRLFENVFKQDLARPLFHALSIQDEPITPHQTTLLKLVDSHLRNPTTTSGLLDYCFLPETFLHLCLYTQLSIGRSLGLKSPQYEPRSQADDDLTNFTTDTEGDDPKGHDLRLPKVSAALVILSQCLNTILLLVQNADDVENSGYSAVCDAIQASGFVESLIKTIRLVDRFLPRIAFGKEVTPSEVILSSESFEHTKGFSYLKRDLVRLLGTLCYERPDMQNRIRECGGIQVVLSLCVIDERNPYMQEHALFALRNILHRNPANQAVVESLQLTERSQS